MIIHSWQRSGLAVCALALLAGAACATTDGGAGDDSASAAGPALGIASPSPARAAPTPTVGAPARYWATQVCAAAQGFLDAFSYGEPYGMPDEAASLEELQAHAAALTARVVPASTLVVQLVLAVRPVEAGVVDYQRTLASGFRELAAIYADYGAAVSAAGSRDDVSVIDARTLAAVERVIRSVRDARDGLPPEPRTALQAVDGCALVS